GICNEESSAAIAQRWCPALPDPDRDRPFQIPNSKFLEQVAKLARSRVAANGAAPPGAEPWAVTSAFLASTRWGLFADRTRLERILQRTLNYWPPAVLVRTGGAVLPGNTGRIRTVVSDTASRAASSSMR